MVVLLCLRRFGRFAVWDTHLKSVTFYDIIAHTYERSTSVHVCIYFALYHSIALSFFHLHSLPRLQVIKVEVGSRLM